MPAFLLNLVSVSWAPVSVREARGWAWGPGSLGTVRWGPQTPGAAACAASAEAAGSWKTSWNPQAQETRCRVSGLGKNIFSFGHLQKLLENSTEFMEVTQCRDVRTHAKVLFILLLQKEQLHKNMPVSEPLNVA